MSELIIASLSGAGLTITVAICVTLLGLRLSDAKEQAGNARVEKAEQQGELKIARINESIATARAEQAERRLLDADALIAEMVRDLPVDGAFERLLRSYTRARSLDGTGTNPGTLPNEPASPGTGSDDLLKPGE